jgi:hypothetical protein
MQIWHQWLGQWIKAFRLDPFLSEILAELRNVTDRENDSAPEAKLATKLCDERDQSRDWDQGEESIGEMIRGKIVLDLRLRRGSTLSNIAMLERFKYDPVQSLEKIAAVDKQRNCRNVHLRQPLQHV